MMLVLGLRLEDAKQRWSSGVVAEAEGCQTEVEQWWYCSGWRMPGRSGSMGLLLKPSGDQAEVAWGCWGWVMRQSRGRAVVVLLLELGVAKQMVNQ